jgi:hypothetical protein
MGQSFGDVRFFDTQAEPAAWDAVGLGEEDTGGDDAVSRTAYLAPGPIRELVVELRTGGADVRGLLAAAAAEDGSLSEEQLCAALRDALPRKGGLVELAGRSLFAAIDAGGLGARPPEPRARVRAAERARGGPGRVGAGDAADAVLLNARGNPLRQPPRGPDGSGLAKSPGRDAARPRRNAGPGGAAGWLLDEMEAQARLPCCLTRDRRPCCRLTAPPPRARCAGAGRGSDALEADRRRGARAPHPRPAARLRAWPALLEVPGKSHRGWRGRRSWRRT